MKTIFLALAVTLAAMAAASWETCGPMFALATAAALGVAIAPTPPPARRVNRRRH